MEKNYIYNIKVETTKLVILSC